ncbi:SIR2 family protein [Streptomyces sp. NPDC060223]|uniref:P-loop NTPase n=1 Tax=unclassified Streptomyces TaxID=2593676 RepID=UPI0036370C23
MEPIDFGDMSDLRIRLQVLAEEADRRLVTVFGSGISSEILPNVTELTGIFREQVPPQGRDKYDSAISAISDPGHKYQGAAAILTRQAGEKAVMRAIRTAVLRACNDVPPGEVANVARNEAQCREYVRSGSWSIPTGYKHFAEFFAGLDGGVRGPVITTNFDPLIEIALHQAGISAEPLPVPIDSSPTLDQMREFISQPVLHIHGYWTGSATSNVPARIIADRPKLDRVLQALLTDSVVLVVGYSGWLDGFMKSLRSRVLNEADALQAEVLWAAYEKEPAKAIGQGVLRELVGAPGFTLYLDVNGHTLFSDLLEKQEGEAQETAMATPNGYSRVPVQASGTEYNPAPFADGHQPGWVDAVPGRWPTLSSTIELERELCHRLDSGSGGGVVAIGPLGEGKSLAARQVAMKVAAARTDWNFLWREPGAPPITEAGLRHVQDVCGPRTVICIDEADLVGDDLAATQGLWGAKDSGLVFLLTSHDRLWWQGAGLQLRPRISDVLFHGITREDSEEIATAWERMGLLPPTEDRQHQRETASERLLSSAGDMAAESNTLFGAVLDVRYGSQLGDRVEDLLRKLRETKLTDEISIGDVFSGICVMQNALDKNGNTGRGASRSVIARMGGLDPVFADGKILKTLGREAAVTFAGDRVYSRHSAIAATVVDILRKDGNAEKIYKLVGRAGGEIRVADGRSEEDGHKDAYLLCQSPSLSLQESVWAAVGAIEGSDGLLEAKVTLMSVLRREDDNRSLVLAQGLAPTVSDYVDFGGAIRAFLNDFSISMRQAHPQTAAGLAALALDDRVGFELDAYRAGYALVSLAKAADRLKGQTGGGSTVGLTETCYVLMERIRGADDTKHHLRSLRQKLDNLDAFREQSAKDLTGNLAQKLHEVAMAAVREAELPIELNGVLSFDTLRRLAERRPGRHSHINIQYGK